MKKILLTLVLMLTTASLWAQKPFILPGNGHINLEAAGKGFDLNMNIDNLTMGELRVLSNLPAARQGYCFMAADLRHIYDQTTWYRAKLEKRADDSNDPMNTNARDYNAGILHLSKAELAFVSRVKARMAKLTEQYRAKCPEGWMVNPSLAVNETQLKAYPAKLKEALGRNGFGIVPGDNIQLFHVYEQNDYADLPSFVTTDLYLQLFHFYFDCVLRDIEEKKFDQLLANYCDELQKELLVRGEETGGEEAEAVAWCRAYIGVAYVLLTGDTPAWLPADYRDAVGQEVKHVNDAQDCYSNFLGYTEARNIPFTYSLFRPRGHYTRSERIKRYFRTMMWMQSVPFGTDRPEQMRRAIVLADATATNAAALKAYHAIFDPLTALMGEPDNVTILQVADVVKGHHGKLAALFHDKKLMDGVCRQIEQVAARQTRIVPKFVATSLYKVNLMPQRYQPDAEVMNEMIDAKSKVTRRGVPKALDVMAAIGVPAAKRLLTDELGETKQWGDYLPTLEKMEGRMGEIDWESTVANHWLWSLKELARQDMPEGAMPYFMLSTQWDKKNLNTVLASYAELKHDAILYAKQPFAAECGAGGPPDPVVKGYVEPNECFWDAAEKTMRFMERTLNKYGLMTEKAQTTTESMMEQTLFLKGIVAKELGGKRLTDEEYSQIEIVGSTFETISLDLVRETDQWLDGWDNVEGADKSVACVADVYTANGMNNPDKRILYEAVGKADEIYVLVEIDGLWYITRGAVFSYREFTQPLGQPRLTDEEWQQKLEKNPRLGVPNWMDEIIVPVGNSLKIDDELYYSSGC